MMGIYKITNVKNKKVYVGSAKNITLRKAEHIRELRDGFHTSRHLQYAFNKYGEDSFIHEILEEVTDESSLLKREAYWMNKYRALDSDYGYNICPPIKGGEANREFREKVEGERNGRAIIKAKDVPVVCEMLNNRIPIVEIAKKYEVNPHLVSFIKTGVRWRDLSQVYLSDEILSRWKNPPSPRGLHPDEIPYETLKLVCNEINERVSDEEIGDRYGLSDAAIACVRKGGCRCEETIHLLDDEVLRLWPYNIHLIEHLIQKKPKRSIKRPSKQLTPDKIQEICSMINMGKSTEEISGELNVLFNIINNIKIGKSYRKYTVHLLDNKTISSWKNPDDEIFGAANNIVEICEMINAGVKRIDIAKKVNMSTSTIREIHNGKTHRYIASKILNQEIVDKWDY